jgi:uncharacterized protein with FMN-binding domain
MKKLFRIFLVIIVFFALVIAGGIIYLTSGLKTGAEVVVNTIDLSQIEVGTYTGVYEDGRWSNEIEVTVQDHKITTVRIIKDVAFVQPGLSDELFGKVIEEQTTDIDTISGATVTSKAYLKAIEMALNNK